jgi:CheY-like chemotaxis protein
VVAGQGIKLLIVDDTPDVRALLRANAELDARFGDLVEATDGAEAVDAARRHPDVTAVVLDFQMPNGNGLEVLPSLRELLPAARIVLFTSDPTAGARALAAGADASFEKGVPVRVVLDHLAGAG